MVEMVNTLKFRKTSQKYAFVGRVDCCYTEETVMVTEKSKTLLLSTHKYKDTF
jgi:hypothetical protein